LRAFLFWMRSLCLKLCPADFSGNHPADFKERQKWKKYGTS
jgi:hypothetical protein